MMKHTVIQRSLFTIKSIIKHVIQNTCLSTFSTEVILELSIKVHSCGFRNKIKVHSLEHTNYLLGNAMWYKKNLVSKTPNSKVKN